MRKHDVLILGGGFAGVMTAKRLSEYRLPNVRIRLVSDRSNFEYHGALYRYAAGHPLMEVCMPLRDIINEDRVEIVTDRVVSIDKEKEMVFGESGSTYRYDTLVIGLGAETNFFGIPGLEEYSFGMKTIDQANELKKHLKQTLHTCVDASL